MLAGWISAADAKDLAASPLIVLPLGAAIAWVTTRLQRRVDQREAALSDAIVAVSRLQAARHFASGLELVHALPPSEREVVAQKLRERGVLDFAEAARDARFALATADVHVPGGLRKYWDKFEVSEDEREEVITLISRSRRRR